MMKYRDHSPRLTKRPLQTSPERGSNTQPPEQPDATRVTHAKSDEPLINVHDKTSRIDDFKEALEIITRWITTRFLPKVRSFVVTLFSRSRVFTAKAAKRIRRQNRTIRLSKPTVKNLLVIGVIFAGGFFVAQRFSSEPESPAALTIDQKVGNNGPIGGTTPDYETVLPEGQTIESLGGWTRVSPPDRNPVFAYVDTIERVKVTVSQQPLPADFSNDPDKDVKDLALDFNAKERVVADDATIYFVGTSTKGPQSVILAKGRTLVLIKSPVQIKNDVWSGYIATLK
jgi:hypothetical protein